MHLLNPSLRHRNLLWSLLLEPGQEQRAKKGHNYLKLYKLPLLEFNSAASMLTPGKGWDMDRDSKRKLFNL